MPAGDFECVSFLDLSHLQWLAAQLDASNAIGFWLAAKDLFLEELDKEAWDCIVGNLAKVVEEGELCGLSADALATIIASDQITCEEEQVHLLQIN